MNLFESKAKRGPHHHSTDKDTRLPKRITFISCLHKSRRLSATAIAFGQLTACFTCFEASPPFQWLISLFENIVLLLSVLVMSLYSGLPKYGCIRGPSNGSLSQRFARLAVTRTKRKSQPQDKDARQSQTAASLKKNQQLDL